MNRIKLNYLKRIIKKPGYLRYRAILIREELAGVMTDYIIACNDRDYKQINYLKKRKKILKKKYDWYINKLIS